MNDLARSAIDKLRAHEDELRALGVRGVSVFGSIARGDAGTASDIDIAVRLGADFATGGFEYFGSWSGYAINWLRSSAVPST